MRNILYILSAMAVMGLAFWAYQENYRTQETLNRAEGLRADIRDAREELAILRAEWAYLNRPDRLLDLTIMNYDRLGLLPLAPEQFALISQVSFPPPPEPEPEVPELSAADIAEGKLNGVSPVSINPGLNAPEQGLFP
ncbi:cell division protein FtsL [Mesobaculum littorinae]|uniref:cell division protein FtsL n=1 Tax=Mesobaculum littorinae TaxID=2486419 RepID=UPI001F4400A2|nr:cell division protein FtsL [Mesobaculum littorinae]